VKTLIVLAAMCGGEWDAVGPAEPVTSWHPVAEAVAKPRLMVFAPYNSERAGQELQSILTLRDEFEISVQVNPALYPAWVQERGQKKPEGAWPIIWWTAGDGTGKISEWASPDYFRNQFLASGVGPDKPERVAVSERSSYPVHSGGHWSVGRNWNPSREVLIAHLQSGQHAGKFSAGYLQGLSRAELLSLHDDDHEGTVRAVQAPRAALEQQASRKGLIFRRKASRSCPSGNCPWST